MVHRLAGKLSLELWSQPAPQARNVMQLQMTSFIKLRIHLHKHFVMRWCCSYIFQKGHYPLQYFAGQVLGFCCNINNIIIKFGKTQLNHQPALNPSLAFRVASFPALRMKSCLNTLVFALQYHAVSWSKLLTNFMDIRNAITKKKEMSVLSCTKCPDNACPITGLKNLSEQLA